MIDLVEVKDGLLVSSPDKVLMKARDPELFPDNIKEYFNSKEKVKKSEILIGLERVIVWEKNRKAVFDVDLFKYVSELGKVECYLSNVPLPGEDIDLYPLFAKYRHGWLVLSPLEA